MNAYESFALVYDRLMADMPYDEWQRMAKEALERYQIHPARIVDLGCGTGSLTLPLAKDAAEVIGIDLSETMLTMAREKANAYGRVGDKVQWVCQDMRSWSIPDPADAVFSFCDCINYITELDDVRAVFEHTARNLRSGGLFMFDMHHARQFEQYEQEQPFTLDEQDIAYMWHCDYDREQQQIEHDLVIFVQDNESERYHRIDEVHVQRAYETETVIEMLKEAGFEQIEVFADFAWQSADEESMRLFVTAVRQ
ncbi:class I SAM-dependent methyltransferase [Paenibacillus sp. SC116]|uniref:class I SAM-dependent DNA methyltransferase n=1 Tax=Paenibacillus sp. SC116 TaxID=2968986 RepID=UPI00215A6C8B|nr:class I SAM-dependent methyltransferase [Paenibacillus sp. SC116]MCR8845847.1 class I SAM-dependent methyltransferase [Paenibacillus sp. SC116]